MSNYDLEWLNSTGFFTIDLGLGRMELLLKEMGDPQNSLKFIHVAGSNGKGSVCSMTETALRKCGFKTGFYCSPHLIKLNERFRINGKPVEDPVFVKNAERVRIAVESLRQKKISPTYFEITTAIALEIFRDENVDYVLWETGLGGRLDATNVVVPLLSVITGISLEHTHLLGNTLGEVAKEKAGIIKRNVPLVCGPMPEEAFSVINEYAEKNLAPLSRVLPYSGTFHLHPETFSQELVLEGIPFRISLPGTYQRNNASTAFTALKILSELEGFDFRKALAGFAETVWNARFQYIPEKNLIIDGAHNPEGMTALAQALREYFPGKTFRFLAGCFADKNAEEVIAAFAPLANEITFIEFDGSGRDIVPPGQLGAMLERSFSGIPWHAARLHDALNILPQDSLTILCGSLHMCGESLEILGLNG